MEKPTLPKGTRDFGPAVMAKRQYILDAIRKVFQKFGFQPLETPAMENLSTLTGKYGDEGDQLLFKILNSGDFLKDVDNSKLEAKNSKLITSDISGKGLRYDLTVPFARYVVMNRHNLPNPFKRYPIQPVWRADRPQKGRYREFYQCDADVVGTSSLTCEAEIILMIREVFQSLKIDEYTIKINHRGVLTGLAEVAAATDNQEALFVGIDKLDKTGEEKVREELLGKGLTPESIDTVFNVLNFQGTTSQKIVFLNDQFTNSQAGDKGVSQLSAVLRLLRDYNSDDKHVEFDIALARGLSYYTGCIFEVKIHNVSIGSVSGGGRYDNLTAAFDERTVMPGVGFSFGVDRLYDAMEELDLFPKEAQASTTILICHSDEETQRFGLKELSELRAAGISAEVYPDLVKIQKQYEYAEKKQIPFVIVLGSEETKNGFLTIKNIETKQQEKLTLQQIIQKLKA